MALDTGPQKACSIVISYRMPVAANHTTTFASW